VRWISTKEYPYMYNMGLSFKDQLQKVGFKIDLQVMDWATLVSTRGKPDQQEVFITGHPTWNHPILQVYLDGSWPGWWTAEKKNRLVSQMLAEPDPERQKALIQELQRFQWEDMPWVRCGENFALRAIRQEIVGTRTRPTGIFGTAGSRCNMSFPHPDPLPLGAGRIRHSIGVKRPPLPLGEGWGEGEKGL
jgi:peptide/nickel transport system substrate-binding protein